MLMRTQKQFLRESALLYKRSRSHGKYKKCVWASLPALLLFVLLGALYRPYKSLSHHISEARADGALRAAQKAADDLLTSTEPSVLQRCLTSVANDDTYVDGSCLPVTVFMSRLRAAGPIIPLAGNQEYNRTKVCAGGCFFAGNLRNAQLVLPNYIYHMILTVASLTAHGNPCFVSIYESGSNDRTTGWLKVLANALKALSVPHEISLGGSIHRENGEDRIHFLARVRSAALTQLFVQCNTSDTFCAGDAVKPSNSPHGSGRVVFLNDVLYSASDILRLLQYPVDLVCGLDLGMAAEPDLTHIEHRQTVAAYLTGTWHLPRFVSSWLSNLSPLRNQWRKFHRKHEPLLREYGPLFFYDKWVARDISGRMFTNREPYVAYESSIKRVVAGRPVRVHCCWNGLAIINAEPLIRGTLRFREHRENECSASECSLLCDDMWRLGYGNIVMDPNVRVTYDVPGANRLYRNFLVDVPLGAPGIGYSPFRPQDVSEVLSLSQHDDLSRESSSSQKVTREVDCCDLAKGADMVEFRNPGVCHNSTVVI